MASMNGDLHVMEPLLDAAEQVAAAADDAFEPTTGRSGSLLVNVPAMIALQRSYAAQLRGQPEATATFARKAPEHLSADELMLSSAVEGFFAVAEWLESDAHTCERALEAAMSSAASPGQPAPPAAGPALVELAAVAYERNELAAALDYATPGITLCRQFVHTPPLAAGLATLSWIRLVTGDREGAFAAMQEAGHFSPGPAGLLNPVPVQRARLMLASGEVAAAARWIHDAGVRAGDEPSYPREPEYLLLARVLLAEGRADQARVLLGRLDAAADRQCRAGSLIEIRALRAVARMADGDEAGALDSLRSALGHGCPQRYVRVFVDEGAPMAQLFGRLASRRAARRADGVSLGCVARIQAAFSAAGAQQPQSSLVEPLTIREREILRLLAAGATNRAIADDLVITVDTVKKHVSHVFRKLGAANRTEAVARAREVGELDLPR